MHLQSHNHHNYCTYFDKNYLPKGLALIESLQKYETDFTLYIVCFDEITRILLEKLQIPQILLIPFFEIEENELRLRAAREDRNKVEYYWTTTPIIILSVLQQLQKDEILIYLDSDMYFFSSPQAIFDELGTNSVLIHKHNFSDYLKDSEKFGIYNVGMLAFKHDTEGLKVLNWWSTKCLKYCSNTMAYDEEGNLCYGDQKYLEYFPTLSEKVKTAENLGIGVAPWNHIGVHLSANEENEPLINGLPVVFYHFHAFHFLNADCVIPAAYLDYKCSLDSIHFFTVPYMKALQRAIQKIHVTFPEYQVSYQSTGKANLLLAFSHLRTYLEEFDYEYFITIDNDLILTFTPQLVEYRQILEKIRTQTLAEALQTLENTEGKARMLNLGCGSYFHEDWINLDIAPRDQAVFTCDFREKLPISDNFFDAVYHSHVLEHMTKTQGKTFLAECYRVLKTQGIIRIAVPDLEKLARDYLQSLEEAKTGDINASKRHEWLIIEIVDQISRHKSGGDMLEYLKQRPVPELNFIYERIGYEASTIVESLGDAPEFNSFEPEDPFEVGSFRLSGEVHRYMYDSFSLAKVLTELGFKDIKIVQPAESSIPNYASYHLDVFENHHTRKPDSLFIEGVK